MNSQTWFATKNTIKLVRYVWKEHRSPRKVQLLLCGVARLVGRWLPDDELRASITPIEEYADFPTDDLDARIGYRGRFVEAQELPWSTPEARSMFVLRTATYSDQPRDAVEQAIDVGGAIHESELPEGDALAKYRQEVCDIIRELYPPPPLRYRQQPQFLGGGILLPDGTTFHVPENAKLIADGIQQDQAFDRLPILADALEDANLSDRALLDHLRHCENHRRGCWAFDIILGRG